MTAEQTPDIEAVLAAHEDVTFDPAMHGRECSCGWGDDDVRRTDAEYHAHVAAALAPVLDAAVCEARAAAWDDGVRQAMSWLRADYEYGTGPDWREQGVEWIADRLAEHNRADRIAVDAPEDGEGR